MQTRQMIYKIPLRLLCITSFCLALISIASTSPVFAACGGTTNVANETELNTAIGDFNSQASACSYSITLTADIDLTASTTTMDNATAGVNLLINGAGFTVDGQGNSGVRPFAIATNTAVEMRNLTITGSKPASGNHGGGIRNNGGDLTLTTVTLTNNNNPTIFGGGLYNDGGTVTIQNNSVISNNQGEFGAGLYNTNGGTLNVYNSVISGNATPFGFGAGIYNFSGTLEVKDSTFSGNDGGGGGAAIENDDSVIIDNSQFIGAGTISGEPIASSGTMVIRNSTISGYDSSTAPGVIIVGDSLTIKNTTISNNQVGLGGGIVSFGFGAINVINSTISGNSASSNEAGIHMFGGTATIINSTIAGNDRGVQVVDRSGVVNIRNSLVVNSSGGNCDINGTLNASGTNFTDDDTCTGLTNDSAAGINLGPLQDNGGATFTHALLDGNPAINTGDNTLAVDENGNPLNTDQRGDGFPRIVGTAVDVGAYESPFLSNLPPTAEAGGPYTVDEGSSVTLDGSGSIDGEQEPATLSYAWDFDGDGQYDDATGINPTFAAVDGPASVTVGLQVTDNGGLTSSASAVITSNNVAPTANAGTSQSVFRNEIVNLSGTWSDPASAADNAYTWSWDLDGDGATDDSGSANFGESINRTTSFTVDGVATLTFTVTDKDGAGHSNTVQITVINRAPSAVEMPVITTQDTAIALRLRGFDPDGDALTYSVESQTSNGTLSGTAPALVYTPNPGFSGFDSFTFKVNDGLANSDVIEIFIVIEATTAPFATCGGYDVFETAPGVYAAPSFAGNLIVGTDGHDWLQGADGPDLILGLGGPDDLWGYDGDDVICGGDGVDIILGMRGDDTLYGDDQPDWLIGGPDNDMLYGGDGWDDLEGNDGNDTLYGESGSNVLLGGASDDKLFGGDEADALFGQNGNDDLDGAGADDYCQGGRGNDTITNCEGASAADAGADINEDTARRSNDGANGEHAIKQRIQQLFLPLVSNTD
ncbi:MAG: choice-of-anchor Q domain-containing protein [Caldilineaceae bacterium]